MWIFTLSKKSVDRLQKILWNVENSIPKTKTLFVADHEFELALKDIPFVSQWSSGTAVNTMFSLAVFGKEIQQSHSTSWHAHIHDWNHPLRWNCHVRSCSCSQSRWENNCHEKTFAGRSSGNVNHDYSCSFGVLTTVFSDLDLPCFDITFKYQLIKLAKFDWYTIAGWSCLSTCSFYSISVTDLDLWTAVITCGVVCIFYTTLVRSYCIYHYTYSLSFFVSFFW